MRPVYVALSAAAASTPWIPLDRMQDSFQVGLAVIPSEDVATLLASVQVTYDPMGDEYLMGVTIARAAAVATATFQYQHGLTTGDTVVITGSGSAQLDSQPFGQQIGPPFTYNINQPVPITVASTPSPTTITYAVANAGPATDGGNAKARIYRVFPVIAALTGLSTRQQTALNSATLGPVTAVRLITTTITAGFIQLAVIQGIGR